MQDEDFALHQRTEERTADAFLTPRSNLEQPLPQAVRKRHSQIGAKDAHALGDPGIVGANAHRPSADRFLDFIAVVEDFPVHVAMLAYLRRYVQLGR